jgi:hypothetical protein
MVFEEKPNLVEVYLRIATSGKRIENETGRRLGHRNNDTLAQNPRTIRSIDRSFDPVRSRVTVIFRYFSGFETKTQIGFELREIQRVSAFKFKDETTTGLTKDS